MPVLLSPQLSPRRIVLALIVLCVGLFAASCGTGLNTSARSTTVASDWKLVWSDEFDQPDGSAPDPSKWTIQTGGGGWGNHELESYTARPENVSIEDGNLVLTARRESYTGADGIARNYTSGRLLTQGKFTQQYGRFEARIKIPTGQGMWPAFWMLGDDIGEVAWPACGEIDIMENIGKSPTSVWGSLHEASSSGGVASATATSTLPSGEKFSADYHLYAVEWEPDEVRFYVDDVLYERRTPSDLASGRRWAFDHPYFLLLNLAVGGDWPGSPNAATLFPQSMMVDYVRVYARP